MSPPRISFFLLLTVCLAFSENAAFASDVPDNFGPVPTQNYSPIALMFLSMPAAKGTSLSKGSYQVSLEWSESSAFIDDTTWPYNTRMEFEIFRSSIDLNYGLTDRLGVGLELPYYYRDSGFLNPIVISVENLFLTSHRKREWGGNNFGEYYIKKYDSTIFSSRDNVCSLGDLILNGQYQFLQEGRILPASSIRAAFKFPTGDFNLGNGSGRADFGFGLAIQKSLAARWIAYFNLNEIFPGGGTLGDTGFSLTPFYSTSFILEFLKSQSVSIEGAYDFYTSPLKNTGVAILDNGIAEFVLGLNWLVARKVTLQFYVVENMVNPEGTAADVTIGTQVRFQN